MLKDRRKNEQTLESLPLPHPGGWGQKVKIQLYSEYGHVAFQIKANDECRKMVANVLPTDLSP